MNTIYINCKTGNKTETIDEFTRGESTPENSKDFIKYVNEMLENTKLAYRNTGFHIYKSQRCCKDWN